MISSINYGTVKGTLKGVDGSPAAGSVYFRPSSNLVGADLILLAKPVTAVLDANGSFVAQLVATDSEDVSPLDFQWEAYVDVAVQGIKQVYDAITFKVPTGSNQDLATLTNVSTSPGTPEAAWWTQQRKSVVGGHMDGTDLVLSRADGTEVQVGSVLDPVKAPVSVDVSNGVGGLVRLTRMDRIVVGSIISAPSNIGSGSSYTFGKVPLGFRPINQGQINEMTLGPAFNANTSKMTGAWQFINLEGAIDHSLALFTNEANGFWIGSIIWATNDAYPTS